MSGYTVVTDMNYVKYFKAIYHLESQTALFVLFIFFQLPFLI